MEAYKSDAKTFSKTDIDFRQISSDLNKRKYRYLGTGSGRVVFDLGDGNVVKVAKNRKGIAQNEAEYKISMHNDTSLLAKVSCISERSTFLIMERAKKIQGISFVWKYFRVNSNKELYQIKELQDISEKHSLEIKDFGRAVNWGQINGKPIIIDYGFTQQVRRKFYMSLAEHVFDRLRE